MRMYTTREEAAEACKYEAAAAERFSSAAIEKAQAGECKAAWNLADQARTAARCAAQAHEDLWELAGEDMTEKEFGAFEKAEIAQMDAARAERAAAAAVEKRNAERRLEQEQELAQLCEKTGVRPEGIEKLKAYYTDTCGWTEEHANEYIKELFENGTIAAIKKL